MRFQPPKGDHKMITDKKCPKSYFIAKLREFAYKGKFETEEDFADTIVPCYDLERMMGILSFDYARCAWDLDGLHLLRWSCTSKTQKNTEAG